MPSRRDILATAAISAAAFFRPVTSLFAAAAQPATPVNFKVPEGACDCHVHVFDPQRFPFFSGRTYTPEPATVAELKEMHRKLRIDRVVIVQASVYGTDNAVTLDALKQLGSNARGVAVIDEHTPNRALDEMQQGGVRGVRINMGSASEGELPLARQRMKATLDRIGGRNWHLQMYLPLALAAAVTEDVIAAPLPIVFDHFAGAFAAGGLDQPGFDKVLKMVQAGKVYVKVSAAYRASKLADYADVAPLAKALIGANPQRILWGSDWPHPDTGAGVKSTEISPLLPIDDGRLLNLLAAWVPEAAIRKTILVDNPARLYGF